MSPAVTDKLYWSDPHLTSFEVDRLKLTEHAGRPSVVLGQTLFYPEGGGQLGDTGSLHVIGPSEGGPGRGMRLSIDVIDTQIDEVGEIHHILAEALPTDAHSAFGGHVLVRGSIDASRRRDHMRQHTAQHALSRALADIARAETVSARLGETSCTIDVSRGEIPDAELHCAEDLVNALVASDVPVRPLYPGRRELETMPLRKQPKVTEGVVRVIEIDSFDLTPCGGTHCTRTGQIGQVRMIGMEKYKGHLRITFHAGQRALDDARDKHRSLTALAADLTCGVFDVRDAVAKLRAELKGARAQLEVARAEVAELVAAAALAGRTGHAADGSPTIVPLLRPGDDVTALRLLAGRLAAEPHVVALTGAVDAATGELVVVLHRGTEGRLDCGKFVQTQTKARDGRGGGRPERAEGRFPKGTTLDELAREASAAVGAP
jgi:alanyl-tRNA synthetase